MKNNSIAFALLKASKAVQYSSDWELFHFGLHIGVAANMYLYIKN